MKRLLVSLLCSLAVTGSALASELGTRVISVEAFAATEQDALDTALIRAVQQVNGTAIDYKKTMTSVSHAQSDGANFESSIEDSSTKALATKAKGFVKSWKIISSSQVNESEHRVEIEAEIQVLKSPEHINRMKIAVVQTGFAPHAPKTNGVGYLANKMTGKLINSRKFAVLDRQNSQIIEGELQRAKNSTNEINKARLGADVSPDFVVVMTPTNFDNSRGDTVVNIEMNIIDYATSQVMFNRNERAVLRKLSDTQRGLRSLDMAVDRLYKEIINKVSMPLVIAMQNGEAVISQGKDYFNVGDIIIFKKKGQMLIDPRTGDRLSAPVSEIAKGKVVSTNATITQAAITEGSATVFTKEDIAQNLIIAEKFSASSKSTNSSIEKRNKDFINGF